MTRFLIFLTFILAATSVQAQDWKTFDDDKLFSLARQKAFNNDRDQAREMLQALLARTPDHNDARTLLGRTYAWDGQHDKARIELEAVLEKSPYVDAYRALADVEIWSNNPNNGLIVVEAGLQNYPTDEELLHKKASILHNLEREDNALAVLQQLLTLHPSNKPGLTLLKEIRTSRKKYNVGVAYGVDVFGRTFDPAHNAALQFGKITRWGSASARLNYARRFLADGLQGEIDLYPRIANGVYAYVNYGYSSTDLFPEHRVGGELFSKLPHALEASAGFRYLYFDEITQVTLYTGSVGWYFGSYWLSARTYIIPNERVGTTASGAFTLRRYLSNAESHLSLSAGFGFSPDTRRIQSSAGLTTDEIYVLRSHRIGVAYQQLLKNDLMILISVDLWRQELIFDTQNFINMTSLSAGLRQKF